MTFSDPPQPEYATVLRTAGWHVYVERTVTIDEQGYRRWLILRAVKGDSKVKVAVDSDQDQIAWPELFQQAQQFDKNLTID